MSTANLDLDPAKLFKAGRNFETTVTEGLRRVQKRYYYNTERAQSGIKVDIANGLDSICIIIQEMEDAKSSSPSPRTLLERELGERFAKLVKDQAKERLEQNTDLFEETEIEHTVCKGILYAVSNSADPIGPFDTVLLSQMRFLKCLVRRYQTGEHEDLSGESDVD